MSVRGLIETLNHLTTGELSTLRRRLEDVRAEAQSQGISEVDEILGEAVACLDGFDLKGFRKKVAHAVSRLGHVRASAS